jgi:hypothetical protein
MVSMAAKVVALTLQLAQSEAGNENDSGQELNRQTDTLARMICLRLESGSHTNLLAKRFLPRPVLFAQLPGLRQILGDIANTGSTAKWQNRMRKSL